MMQRDPNVASIPPSANFLSVLVDRLLNGTLIPGFNPMGDPLALSKVTVWVPTRRAVRALSSEFVSRFPGEVALLPSIRALGDVDEDELWFNETSHTDTHELITPIGSLERQLILSRLVNAWAKTLNPDQRALYRGDEIIMPSSLSDAVWFAADLARLMDTVSTEEADWSALHDLVPDDHADWWKLTLEFLQIATARWPEILAEKQHQDGAVLRAQMLRKQAAQYAKNGNPGPVIAAGSTGSIPATADLLKTISQMENGLVVLPGLDRDLDNETWQKIDLPDNPNDDHGSAPGHPQYGLKKLLDHLGVGRNTHDIPHLVNTDEDNSGRARIREKLISEALRPSDSTGQWQSISTSFDCHQKEAAFDGVALVEATGEREEALAIALALRETLQDNDKTAALITPDRNLARRVATEMRRFGIPVDDSAGLPLRNTPAGTFARLVLQVRFKPSDPIALVSLLKHPKTRLGRTKEDLHRAADLFELAILRGAITPPEAGQFGKILSRKRKALEIKGERIPRSVRRFSEQDWDELSWLCEKLDDVFGQVTWVSKQPTTSRELIAETIGCIELCGMGTEENLCDLYDQEDGKALRTFLSEFIEAETELELAPQDWPEIVDALIAQKVTRPVGGTHPRVSILGPLEARLQTYNRVVLGGLNEKTWPAPARNDAFLSRPMKVALGLPPPERRTGLAAHDFQILLGHRDVVITRSLKVGNAPSVASRWVQRVEIVGGQNVSQSMRQRGQRFLDWARQVDQPNDRVKSCPQPRPTPPLAVRPTRLSITEIETWISDPYAIYAKHILKLEALEPLLREADAREKGTLYHKIFENIVRQIQNPMGDHTLDEMVEIAHAQFEESAIPAEHAALWWPRLEKILQSYLDWHRAYQLDVQRISTELEGSTSNGLDGFTLSGRVDRVDFLKDGSFSILDYKTGKFPPISKVKSLHAPQLPLSAAMVLRGGFDEATSGPVNCLSYVRLRPTDELEVDTLKQTVSEEIVEKSWKDLNALIEAYRDPNKAYLSKARAITDKSWESDYDHLARVLEWSTGDDGGEGDA